MRICCAEVRVAGRMLALVSALGLMVACARHRDESVRAWGTIEATEVRISSRVPGKVDRVAYHEGARVRRGEELVRLDLGPLGAQRDQTESALEAAKAREELLQAGARKEDVQAARDALSSAHAREKQTREQLHRARALTEGGAAPRQELEAAQAAQEVAHATVESQRAQLRKLLGGARAQELEEAAAARSQAEAALRAIEVQLQDAKLVSPVEGAVIHRMVEPGEVIRPGEPLLVVGELSRPWIDVYVPEPRVARVQPGTEVEIHVDAWSGRVFRGRVRSVSTQAEFTPRNVQTEDQRARLVYRTRIDVDDPEGLLLPGMPAFVVLGEKDAR